jgi:hypothetical protein
MTGSPGKPLPAWTEAELDGKLETLSRHTDYNVNDLLAERDRRERRRSQSLATAATIAAAVAALGSAAAAFAALWRT